jgi:hypothetical protein
MYHELLEDFTGNINEFIGQDSKYHTVYYIEFDTGHFYIGKRSTFDIKNDEYFASGILPNKLKKNNIKYERKILFFFENSSGALEKETEILSNSKYYNNELCLNLYPGSPPDLTGSYIISKDNVFKMINPKLLEHYLELGWERKGIKRIWVSKDESIKYILPEEVDCYLSEGWFLGNVKSRERIFIHKDGKYKFVKKNHLHEFIKTGWIVKHNQEGMKVLRDNKNNIIKVKSDFVEMYLKGEYRKSSTVEGLIYIHKDRKFKRIPKEQIDYYLSIGWNVGNNTTGKIYITDGKSEMRIYEDELNKYPEFSIGRLKKLYLNNGVIEKRIFINDDSKINKYIKNGFSIGKLERKIKKIQIYKDDKKIRILSHEFYKYETEGWSLKYDKNIHTCKMGGRRK